MQQRQNHLPLALQSWMGQERLYFNKLTLSKQILLKKNFSHDLIQKIKIILLKEKTNSHTSHGKPEKTSYNFR